jgi:hypothetical protein
MRVESSPGVAEREWVGVSRACKRTARPQVRGTPEEQVASADRERRPARKLSSPQIARP